jgi:hypothetical protein
MTHEDRRTIPKRMKRILLPETSVIAAPASAPTMVNISRNMPTLRLVIQSLTYAEAEPLDVAMTETILTAMAYLMSIPNNVSTGMRIMPPPIPLMAPMNPATIEIKKRT